jgi:hypothetical protein
MTDREQFVKIQQFLVEHTGSWSANKVYAVAQCLGVTMGRGQALKAIRALCGSGNRGRGRPLKPTALVPIKNGTVNGTTIGTENGTDQAEKMVQAPVQEPLSPAPPIPVSPSVPSGVKNNGRVRGVTEPDRTWVTPLKAAVNAMRYVEMKDLTIEQRVLVGRYHAFKFENCTGSETTNRRAGEKHIAQYLLIGTSDQYCSLTVEDYFLALSRVYEANKTLIRNPWDFRGGLEIERPA